MRAALRCFVSASLVVATKLPAQSAWTVEARPLLEITAFRDPFGSIVGAATLRDGSIVVADQSNLQLYTFRADGKPVSAIGRSGDGPGEFRTMVMLGRCAPDTVSVFDPVHNRVTNVTGGTLAGMRPAKPPGPAGYVPDGRNAPYTLACAPNGNQVMVGWPIASPPREPGPHRSLVNIGIARARSLFTRLGTFAGPERYRYARSDGPRTFGKQLVVAVSPTRVFVGTADSFHVDVFDLDGKRQAGIRRTHAPKPLTDRERAGWEAQVLTRIGRRMNEAQVKKSLDDEELPGHFPPYDRFIVEGTRLWIQEARAPTEALRRWWGFEEDGRAVGTLVVPAALELYEIDATTVFGKWTDEDGAEGVRRHRLLKSR